MRLASREEQERVEREIRNPTTAPSYELLMNGVPHELKEASRKTGDSGSLQLDAVLAGSVPARLANADVRFSVEVAGSKIPRLWGKATGLQDDGPYTRLVADSPGVSLGDRSFGPNPDRTAKGFWRFAGIRPNVVLWDVASRGVYDMARVDIAPVSEPLVDKEYPTRSSLAEARTEVMALAGLVGVDTADLGWRVFKDPGLGSRSRVSWEYDANGPEVFRDGWKTSLSRKLYSVVVLYRDEADGTTTEWSAPVDNSGLENPPPKDAILWEEFADFSPEADAKANKRVRELAEMARLGVWTATLECLYNPLLERYDQVLVTHVKQEAAGLVRRVWLLVIETPAEQVPGWRSSFAGTATILEEGVVVPTPVRVAKADQATTPPVGIAATGDLRIDDSVPWATKNEEGDLVIADGAPVKTDEDGSLVIEDA